MSFAFLKTWADYQETIRVCEECFRKKNLHFIKSSSETVTEFEVDYAAYFRTVVEPNRAPKVSTWGIPSITSSKGAIIEIRFRPGASSTEVDTSRSQARQFVQCLAETFPQKPWVGIDSIFHSEERKWREFL